MQVGVCLWAYQVSGVQIHGHYHGIIQGVHLCGGDVHWISVNRLWRMTWTGMKLVVS